MHASKLILLCACAQCCLITCHDTIKNLRRIEHTNMQMRHNTFGNSTFCRNASQEKKQLNKKLRAQVWTCARQTKRSSQAMNQFTFQIANLPFFGWPPNTVLPAGLAVKMHGHLVKGFTPLRAGVASFFLSFMVRTPPTNLPSISHFATPLHNFCSFELKKVNWTL